MRSAPASSASHRTTSPGSPTGPCSPSCAAASTTPAGSTGPPNTRFRQPDAMTALLNDSGRDIAIEQVIQFFFAEQWSARCALTAPSARSASSATSPSSSATTPPTSGRTPKSSSSTTSANPRASPVFRPTTSPPPASAGAIRSTTGALLEERGFDWWVARIRRSLALYDIVRLDHFRGFEAFWSIAADEETAINGHWVKAPGHALFKRLKEIFGDLPFIAEDLGLITPEVDELREYFGMPGMRILQFGFAERGGHTLSAASLRRQHRRLHRHARQQHHARLVARRHHSRRAHQRRDLSRSRRPAERHEIVWAMIRAAADSVANIASIPCRTFSNSAAKRA